MSTMNRIESVLVKIAEAFNSSNLLWGVGASVLLHKYNLIESPSDIDIITSTSDIEKADRILSSFGERLPEKTTEIYSTEYFYEYLIEGVNIDLMAGLKINTNESVFSYIFDSESIPHHFKIKGVSIPFSALEDWFVLYQLIPGREQKVSLISNYFKVVGVEYPALLYRMMDNNTLPNSIQEELKKRFIGTP